MRRVIFNQKGGVGKSTIACNLAAISAASGQRTLVVDLDPQSNATDYLLGKKAMKINLSLAEYFEDTLSFSLLKRGPEAYVHPTPYSELYIMPAHARLGEIQHKLEAKYKIFKLKEALDSLGRFQRVFIDTPPAMNFYTTSALIASDTCLIPFDCDDFSRKALYVLMDAVQEIREDHNRRLEVEGIVVNQFQPRARFPREVVAELTEEGLPVMNTKISASVKIRESHARACPMIHLDPKHKITQQFCELFNELRSSPHDWGA